jgi:alpha-galactosidase/6-phospho-beta-glucosidase family protein
MPGLKIAIIGAGSVGFTRKLVTDVLCVPELQYADIALTDIDERNLGMVREILETVVAVNRLPTRISATTDRRRALEGARYVINCARIGGLEAFADDIRIPLQYGVDQCVGDTICAGGILYGQRSIPAILDFCRDIREVCEPRAKFLNYANPMAMNTWAAIDHGKVETIGLCHGIQHGWRQIAEALGAGDSTESNGHLSDRFGLNMAAGLTLPLACAATCTASINVQRMAVEAAVTGDVDLLKLAVLHDPLVGAICSPDEVWRMVDEMLAAQAVWLPQYGHAIGDAKRRLKSAPARKTEQRGAARRPVRSVEELRAARVGERKTDAGNPATV